MARRGSDGASWLRRGGEEVSVDRGAHALAYAFGVMVKVVGCGCVALPPALRMFVAAMLDVVSCFQRLKLESRLFRTRDKKETSSRLKAGTDSGSYSLQASRLRRQPPKHRFQNLLCAQLRHL